MVRIRQHCWTLLRTTEMESSAFVYGGGTLTERRAAALVWHSGAVGHLPNVSDIELQTGDVALLTGLALDVDKNNKLVMLGELRQSGRYQTWFTRAVDAYPGWVCGDACGLVLPAKMRFVWRGDVPVHSMDNLVQLLAPAMASLIPYYDWSFKTPPPSVVMPQAPSASILAHSE